jgi:hypothetical protein
LNDSGPAPESKPGVRREGPSSRAFGRELRLLDWGDERNSLLVARVKNTPTILPNIVLALKDRIVTPALVDTKRRWWAISHVLCRSNTVTRDFVLGRSFLYWLDHQFQVRYSYLVSPEDTLRSLLRDVVDNKELRDFEISQGLNLTEEQRNRYRFGSQRGFVTPPEPSRQKRKNPDSSATKGTGRAGNRPVRDRAAFVSRKRARELNKGTCPSRLGGAHRREMVCSCCNRPAFVPARHHCPEGTVHSHH